MTVPADALRTKPRAMNYALPFCRGEIVGVYDAEDRPDPGQIRAVVAAPAWRRRPRSPACRATSTSTTPRDNWLSRCFTIEYAIWFRVVLLGVQRLGLPIPLGGTTVFFRRSVLEEIGAWDAHNVTEDADLGMRLARFGYRCEMIATTTWRRRTAGRGPGSGSARAGSRATRSPGRPTCAGRASSGATSGRAGFLGFQVLFLGGDHLVSGAAALLGDLDGVRSASAWPSGTTFPAWLSGASSPR